MGTKEKSALPLPEFIAFKRTLPHEIQKAIFSGRIPWSAIEAIDPLSQATNEWKTIAFSSVTATEGFESFSQYSWNDPHLLYEQLKEFLVSTIQKGKNPIPYIRLFDAFRFDGIPVFQTIFGSKEPALPIGNWDIGVDAYSSDSATNSFAVVNPGRRTKTSEDMFISLLQLHQLGADATGTHKFLHKLTKHPGEISAQKLVKHIHLGARRQYALAVLQLQKQIQEKDTLYQVHVGIAKPNATVHVNLIHHDLFLPLNVEEQNNWTLDPGSRLFLSSGIDEKSLYEAAVLTKCYSSRLASQVTAEIFRQNHKGSEVFGSIAVVTLPKKVS